MSLMAISAGDRGGVVLVGNAREVLPVYVRGHGYHGPCDVFVRIRIGGEIGRIGLRVAGVAEQAIDAEADGVPAHGLHQILYRDVFGQNLKILRGPELHRRTSCACRWGAGRRSAILGSRSCNRKQRETHNGHEKPDRNVHAAETPKRYVTLVATNYITP